MDKVNIIYIIGMISNLTIYLMFMHQYGKKKPPTKYIHIKKILRIISIFFFGFIVPITAKIVYPNGNYIVPDSIIWMATPFMVLSIITMYYTYKDVDVNSKFNTAGIYKYVRHPMYLAVILFLIAQGMLLPNRIGIFSSVISISILIMSKIPIEEKLLIHEFGFEYIGYMKETAEIIPFLF